MDKTVIRIFISLWSALICCSSASLFGQSETYVVRDFESWSSLEAKVRISKKLSAVLSHSIRLEHNASQYQQSFSEVDIGFKPSKYLGVKTGFRIINQVNSQDQNSNHLRYFFSASLKHKAADFTFQHRLMFTNKNELRVTQLEGDDHIKHFRVRTEAKYNIKDWKLDPISSIELFRRYEDGESHWNKLRFKLGTELNLKAFGRLSAFYAIEKEYGRSLQPTNYIIGLSYRYTFKLYNK